MLIKMNYELNSDYTIKSYCFLPLDEDKPYIEIDDKDMFSIELGVSKIVGNSLILNEKECENRLKLGAELKYHKQWLIDNDWKINKITTEEWSKDDPRWISYLKDRKGHRDRMDQIIEELEA